MQPTVDQSERITGRLAAGLRKLGWIVVTLAVVGWLVFLHYTLPRTSVVQLTVTDVVRMDRPVGDTAGPPTTRDVRFVNALAPDGDARVYRNEDTGWGWPPYFKFDSGTLASEADGIIRNSPDAWVLVSYYGWRIEMFSEFPNLLDVEIVEKDHSHIPWFTIMIVVVIHGALLWLVLSVRRRWRRRKPNPES